jgi:hypothetical protein
MKQVEDKVMFVTTGVALPHTIVIPVLNVTEEGKKDTELPVLMPNGP